MTPTPDNIKAATSALDEVRDEWMQRSGVTGLDVGLKRKGERLTNELAIRVHVRDKLPLDEVPEDERFPENLGTFDVDVIQASYAPETPGESEASGSEEPAS